MPPTFFIGWGGNWSGCLDVRDFISPFLVRQRFNYELRGKNVALRPPSFVGEVRSTEYLQYEYAVLSLAMLDWGPRRAQYAVRSTEHC